MFKIIPHLISVGLKETTRDYVTIITSHEGLKENDIIDEAIKEAVKYKYLDDKQPIHTTIHTLVEIMDSISDHNHRVDLMEFHKLLDNVGVKHIINLEQQLQE